MDENQDVDVLAGMLAYTAARPTYAPPDRLPPPLVQRDGSPVPPILLGLAAALVCGIALFVASRFVYVYVLYNSLIGLGIGAAMGLGIRRARYTSEAALLLVAWSCSVLSYLVFDYSLYHWILPTVAQPWPTFVQFLQIRAEHDTFIFDIRPGTVGNILVWIVEAGITAWFATQCVLVAIRHARIQSVPPAVTEFVLHLMSRDCGLEAIEQELGRRGWNGWEDQQKAIRAAASADAVLKDAEAQKWSRMMSGQT